ncbi:MAG: HEPN domain-containing protein [Candidatus Aenigmarchaeota archaeon]|nr:HEPN domain-containing protein [Candidatus Aenigmarchaeota archaeon]
MDIEECIRQGYLLRARPDQELMVKELKESDYDLKSAQAAFRGGDAKWSIVKSYYAMFHAARALLFAMGMKERRHFAVAVVLESLNKAGRLEAEHLSAFHSAMSAREDADYRYTYSKETAETILEAARQFAARMKALAKGGQSNIPAPHNYNGAARAPGKRGKKGNAQPGAGGGDKKHHRTGR